ncbi:DNA polymerase I [Patescibacteria group bacterium]|nr:DNA polymerase I [Patescibacteria group bacterium]
MQKTPKNTKRYMLVDGNALVHRAFHAIPNLTTKSGEPTNAVYGFTVILLKAMKDINPTHIALTFDLAGPTFRHEKYDEYKATRVKAADELYQQIPICKEVVRALGINIFEKAGFEADDALGTLVEKIKEENKGADFEVLIVTGDLDTLQLVDGNIKVYTLRKGLTDIMIYDRAAVRQRYGIEPEQMVDFKAIKGDPSDNIKGIKGIGEKGALDLIKEYGSIEGIYKNLDKLKERTRKMFEEQKDQLKLSRELSKIVLDVPLDYNLPQYHFSQIDYSKVVELFQRLEFKSLIQKLPKVEGAREITPEQAQKIEAKENSKYILVNTPDAVEKLGNELSSQKEFAFDTETTGLGAIDHDLVGISLSWEKGKAYYVPAAMLKTSEAAKLKQALQNPQIKKTAHNIKYDYLALKRFGILVSGAYFDTMIASYLLSPGSRSHDLDTLAFSEFGYQMQPIEELIGKGKQQITMDRVAAEKISFYACEDADYTWRLREVLAPRLQQEGLEKIFFDIEMPLAIVLAHMEENGILLDTDLFTKLEKQADKDLKLLEERIYKQAGQEFNINSPAQLKVILFEKLQLPVMAAGMYVKKTKTGFSTAASELEKMRDMHPIIAEILDYRELAKLQSTYISALPKLLSKDGRLHTSFNQTIAATGRLSSSNPNLQNIPVADSGVASEIRKGFVADKGYKLLSVDYSQIELRVVAHLSGDKNMIEIFNSEQDIHTATAMQLYGEKDPKKITKEMRRDAKTINFGVLYGVSSFGLSERVDMSRGEAADFIKKYYGVFAGVKKYLEKVIEQTREKGYVENELGRRRYIPEINSSQFQIRSAAERAAINMPVQSLAADIIKIAMNRIAGEIDIQSGDIKLLLQVHDELVFEVRENKVAEYAKKIKQMMQDAYNLEVPLLAEAKAGQNWTDMEAV